MRAQQKISKTSDNLVFQLFQFIYYKETDKSKRRRRRKNNIHSFNYLMCESKTKKKTEYIRKRGLLRPLLVSELISLVMLIVVSIFGRKNDVEFHAFY